MLYLILSSLSLVLTIKGVRKLVLQKDMSQGNKMMAYAFFINALCNVMKGAYGLTIFEEIVAIKCYYDYIEEEEAK